MIISDNIKGKLEKYTKVHTLELSDVEILISELGGKILGIDFGFGNILWVNPKLENILENGDWNLGGIRTWISPERDFFIRALFLLKNGFVQLLLIP